MSVVSAVPPRARLTWEPRSRLWKDQKCRNLNRGAGAEISQEPLSRWTSSHSGWLLGHVCSPFHRVSCTHVSGPHACLFARVRVCACVCKDGWSWQSH